MLPLCIVVPLDLDILYDYYLLSDILYTLYFSHVDS